MQQNIDRNRIVIKDAGIFYEEDYQELKNAVMRANLNGWDLEILAIDGGKGSHYCTAQIEIQGDNGLKTFLDFPTMVNDENLELLRKAEPQNIRFISICSDLQDEKERLCEKYGDRETPVKDVLRNIILFKYIIDNISFSCESNIKFSAATQIPDLERFISGMDSVYDLGQLVERLINLK